MTHLEITSSLKNSSSTFWTDISFLPLGISALIKANVSCLRGLV